MSTATKPDINRQFALQAIKSNPHSAQILNEMLEALEMILPLAEAYLRHAPSSPDNAKLETARAAIRKARG